MSRRVKDASLDSREARAKLKPRGKPYWRSFERGLHIGYRKLKGKPGTWWARHYIGNQDYQIEAIGAADDLTDADGVAILNCWQVQDKARERLKARAHAAAGKHGPLTVADAMEDYLEFLRYKRKSAETAASHFAVHIKNQLGAMEVAALTEKIISRWHADLAKAAPKVRTVKGRPHNQREVADTDDARRGRRASANRKLTTLKAALNRVWREGKVSSDAAWRRVEPFEGVDAARARYLTIAEAKRLINGSEPEFRKLVQGALQTGARYGELAALQVQDFNPDVGTLAIRQAKSGKPRQVVPDRRGLRVFQGDLYRPRWHSTDVHQARWQPMEN